MQGKGTAIILASFALSLMCLNGCVDKAPSDEVLEKQFSEQRPGMQHLVKMMIEDRQMTRIATDFMWRYDNVSWPRSEEEWGISKQRWNDYKKLFDQTKVKGGLSRQDDSSDIEMFVHSSGLVTGGTTIGFIFCAIESEGYHHTKLPCLQGKDSGTSRREGYRYRYKKLDADWYIFEESD